MNEAQIVGAREALEEARMLSRAIAFLERWLLTDPPHLSSWRR